VSRKNWSEITAGFAIGVGVGTMLGILLAPQSGEETRAYLRDRAGEGLDEAKSQGTKLARRAQAAADNARDFVSDAVENGRAAMERGKAAYRDARG
jgi:gas vesicle protein